MRAAGGYRDMERVEPPAPLPPLRRVMRLAKLPPVWLMLCGLLGAVILGISLGTGDTTLHCQRSAPGATPACIAEQRSVFQREPERNFVGSLHDLRRGDYWTPGKGGGTTYQIWFGTTIAWAAKHKAEVDALDAQLQAFLAAPSTLEMRSPAHDDSALEIVGFVAFCIGLFLLWLVPSRRVVFVLDRVGATLHIHRKASNDTIPVASIQAVEILRVTVGKSTDDTLKLRLTVGAPCVIGTAHVGGCKAAARWLSATLGVPATLP